MWEKVKLNDLCDVITCGVAKRPDYVELGVPFLSSLNVKENRIILDKYNYVSEQDHYKLTKYAKPEKGDILYTRVGSFGQAAVIDIELEFSVFVSLTLIKPKKKLLNSRYLMWYLNSPKVRQFASENTSGIGVQNLNVSVVRKYEIPLPPLPIQEKIAEILGKADELRRKDKDLRDRYDELAEAIFMDMFGDPVRNEKGWDVKTLKELCLKIGSGSTPTGGNGSYKNEGISLIRSLNIHQNEFKYKDLAFIDEKQADKLKNVIVEANDILFNITGASVCRTTVVPSNVLPARVNQHVAILRFDKEHVAPFFAVRLLSNAIMNRHLYAIATQGGATREAITKEQLQKLEIIVPPIHLQEDFANKIELINQLKAQTNAEKSEELFQSLIQKAFKYELTID